MTHLWPTVYYSTAINTCWGAIYAEVSLNQVHPRAEADNVSVVPQNFGRANSSEVDWFLAHIVSELVRRWHNYC